MPVLERRIETIDTVITAAPLMGLLGTITGMIVLVPGTIGEGGE